MKTDSTITIQKLTPEATLHQIISVNSNAPHLLQSIGLDLRGRADKTLREICFEKQWNEMEMLEWIKRNPPAKQITTVVDTCENKKIGTGSSIEEICNFLSAETLPVIKDLASQTQPEYERICKIHGIQYTWLKEAKWHVNQLINTLQYFKKFETETFYPLAIALYEQGEQIMDGSVQNLKRSLTVIKKDHNQIEEKMQLINEISSHFHFDGSACSSLRILCIRLKTLFELLPKHIDIETEYLLPEIENQLTNR